VVVNVAFDQGAEMGEVLTWCPDNPTAPKRQKVTFRWFERYLDEQWIAIPHQVKDAGGLGDMNWTQLAADMDALHGKVAV
jgi:hypothetical protein